jgi:hypothetical protein
MYKFLKPSVMKSLMVLNQIKNVINRKYENAVILNV